MSEKNLHVYDPAMCCSTGVCGADVDKNLVRFAADLEWLGGQGVQVQRFNLAQQTGAFVSSLAVKEALDAIGESALPMLLVNGRQVMSGAYPTREQLAAWFGIAAGADKPKAGGCSPKSGCC